MTTRNFLVQQLVRVKGLNNVQYNGKLGHIVPFPSAELTNNGRYRVQLKDEEVAPPLLTELSVKPENLDHVCVRCHKEGEKLMTCAKCRQATTATESVNAWTGNDTNLIVDQLVMQEMHLEILCILQWKVGTYSLCGSW